MSTSATMVATLLCAVSAKITSTAVRAESATTSVRLTCLSAARPPSMLPRKSPPPKSTSSHGTEEEAKPETSVRVKAM